MNHLEYRKYLYIIWKYFNSISINECSVIEIRFAIFKTKQLVTYCSFIKIIKQNYLKLHLPRQFG